MRIQRALFIVLALCALAACRESRTRWLTTSGENGAFLVREYRTPEDRVLHWVLRIDLSAAQASSYDQRWTGDDLALRLGTARGVVDLAMKTSVTKATFTIDGQRFDAAAGQVLTLPVGADGRFGAVAQGDRAAYKPLY